MFGNDTWQSLGAMIVLVYVTIMQYTIEFKTLLALLKVVFITIVMIMSECWFFELR